MTALWQAGRPLLFRHVLILAVLLVGVAGAAMPLSVNGWQVDGLRLDLLQDISYVPAGPMAEALGAELVTDHGSGLVTLRMGGRTVQLRIFASAAEARDAGAFTLNGTVRNEPGAIFTAGTVYLPVKAVTHAFGGHITVLSGAEPAVVVALPRGVLRELHGQRDGEGERLVVSLSNAVPYSAYFNEPLGVLHIRFERTEPATGTTLEGDLFRYATVVGDRSAAELRIGLDADTQYSLHAVPNGNGYQLAVNLFRKSESRQTLPSWRVVLDPGLPAGGDPALPLVRAVAQELRDRGLDVHLSRTDASVPTLSGRAASGSGADLFLSFSISPAGNEDYSLYYLGEAQTGELLERAIRLNAEDALPDTSDRLRRQILLGLVPDLVAGRRLADELQGQLYSRPDWQGGGVHQAPLRVLAGAGGRGVLLELTAAAAADPGLPALLATGIQNALRGR